MQALLGRALKETSYYVKLRDGKDELIASVEAHWDDILTLLEATA